MNNKFNQITALRNSFEFNLDDVASNKFETTKSLFENFGSAFNVKALAIATLMGLSGGALSHEQTPLTAIQETFNQSIQMVNVNYRDDLPTYFENKKSIKDDIMLKNEFWQGSVATLIVDDINPEIADSKYREQMKMMTQNAGTALYVSEFVANPLSIKRPPTSEEYLNQASDYKHYFRNDNSSPILVDLKNKLKPENQMYFDDFITYHEMAHGSFEQENARINDTATLKLETVSQLESHSDVSSLLMIANKYGLDYKQFKSLTSDIIEGRSIYAGLGRDFNHNTAVVLSELLHTLDQNPNIYKNMSNEKISAFSAYFVHEFFNQDPKKLFTKLESESIPTSINQFFKGFEEYRDVLKKTESENGYILDRPNMGGGSFYMYMVEDIYFTRNPEKLVEYNNAASNGYITRAAKVKMEAVQSFMNQSESDKAIYAVEAHKLMKNITIDTYSNYLSSYYNPSSIIKVHDQSVLADVLKNNKTEINKEISAERVAKNKI